MERTWRSTSKKLNKGILSAITELHFEQMTPVQVKSPFIALCSLHYHDQINGVAFLVSLLLR